MQGHRNWVLAVSWSPDGLVVASADMDGVIWLWQSSNGETLGCCRGELGHAHNMTYGRNEKSARTSWLDKYCLTGPRFCIHVLVLG